MPQKFILQIISGSFLLSLLYLIFDYISGSSITFYGLLLGFIAHLLLVSCLVIYISNSTLKGIQLILAVFLIYFIIGFFNILIEAYIFNVTDQNITLQQLFRGFITTLIFSPLLVCLLTLFKKKNIYNSYTKRNIFSWTCRILLGMFLYFVFYLAAGMILQASYPDLMNFYQGKIPPLQVMLLTQFPRGLIFVGISILMLRTLNLSVLEKAVLIGFIFSIIGGIAPLIPPNEHMPSSIRWVHGIEVGISNFLYGFALGYLLNQKRQATK